MGAIDAAVNDRRRSEDRIKLPRKKFTDPASLRCFVVSCSSHCSASSARRCADIVVTMEPAVDIQLGGTEFIEVWVTSTADAVEPDKVFSFKFELNITPVPTGLADPLVRFLDPPAGVPQPYLTESDYILFDHSLSVANGEPVGATGKLPPLPPDLPFPPTVYAYSGTDTHDPDDTSVELTSASGRKLLARAEITTIAAPAPGESDTFDVTFNLATSRYYISGDDDEGVLFTSPLGTNVTTVTIVAANSAIPEPSSLLLVATIGIGFFGVRRYRRRIRS